MKIIVIQENGRHEANRAFRECFSVQRAFRRLGHECDVWGLGHENFGNSIDFNSYDLLINAENYTWEWLPDLARIDQPLKLNWAIDAHCRGHKEYKKLHKRGKFDLTLQATKNYLDSNSIWFPNCYDDELIHPLKDVDKKHRLGFCGNRLNRSTLLDELTEKHGLVQDIFVIGDAMVRAINSYHIHFNKNIANDINYRSFETIGCGSVLLTNYNHQYEELGFIHEYNCLIYRDESDLVDILKRYQSNEELLAQIAQNGLALARQHTMHRRISTLVNFLNDCSAELRSKRLWSKRFWKCPLPQFFNLEVSPAA